MLPSPPSQFGNPEVCLRLNSTLLIMLITFLSTFPLSYPFLCAPLVTLGARTSKPPEMGPWYLYPSVMDIDTDILSAAQINCRCRCSMWMMQIDTTLIPLLLESHGSNRSTSKQKSWLSKFKAILHVDLTWPLISFVTSDLVNMCRFSHIKNHVRSWWNWISTLEISECYILNILILQLFSFIHNLTYNDLWPWYMTFDHMNKQRIPYQ